jgi:mycothiol synthase
VAVDDHPVLRPAQRGDLPAVAAVLIAEERVGGGKVVLGEEFVRAEWDRVGFDPAADALTAVDRDGAIVGFAQAFREEPTVVECWGVVHPEHRGRGIGGSLLDAIDRRADVLLEGAPGGRIRHAIDARDEAAADLLRARGFTPVRHFWHMEKDLSDTIETSTPPDGIAVGIVRSPEDLQAIHAILESAFAEDWGYHPEPFERWLEEQASGSDFDPDLWVKASEGATPVGVLTATRWGDRGWIGEVAVLRAHRGRGIASALLRRSFASFAERGISRALLNVDAGNPTGATALYERVGMRVVRRWDLWERSIGSSDPRP